MNIYGNKSLSFIRVKKDMRNYNLLGNYTIDNSSNLIITNQSIYFCDNQQKIDYSSNSKDSINILSNTLNGYCNDTRYKNIIDKLSTAEYYRL